MLVDAETLEPSRDGFSRVFGQPTDWIKPELFESFVEITTTVVEHAGRSRGRVAPAAARGGRAGCGARPRGARDRLASDCARACAASFPSSATVRLKAKLGPPLYRQHVCGLHVHVSVPDPDTCLRAFEGVCAAAAGPPRRLRELPVLGRRAERLALDPLPDPARDADRRASAATAELGRLAGRDPRRQHAPPLGRLAAAGVRNARSSRDRPADIGPADGRARRRGTEAGAGGCGSSTGHPFDRDGVRRAARCRRARRRRAGSRAPARARAAGCRAGDRGADVTLR